MVHSMRIARLAWSASVWRASIPGNWPGCWTPVTAYRCVRESSVPPLMHETLGTTRLGGTVRFSLGAFTTSDEIDTAVAAVTEIAHAAIQV